MSSWARRSPAELALVLAASKAANGIAWEVALAELADADASEIWVQASLHNAKQALLCRPRMGLDATVYPAGGPVGRLLKSACVCTFSGLQMPTLGFCSFTGDQRGHLAQERHLLDSESKGKQAALMPRETRSPPFWAGVDA